MKRKSDLKIYKREFFCHQCEQVTKHKVWIETVKGVRDVTRVRCLRCGKEW